jgi:hypothetical protein
MASSLLKPLAEINAAGANAVIKVKDIRPEAIGINR